MRQSTLVVGIDAHQDSVTLAVLPEGAEECEDSRTLPNDLGKLRRHFLRLQKRGKLRARATRRADAATCCSAL